MEFTLSSEILALQDRTRQFFAEQAMPLEIDERQSPPTARAKRCAEIS